MLPSPTLPLTIMQNSTSPAAKSEEAQKHPKHPTGEVVEVKEAEVDVKAKVVAKK